MAFQKSNPAPVGRHGARNNDHAGWLITSESSNRPAIVQEAARYVRVPVLNSDRHTVGFELVRIGPGLRARIRDMVAEGGDA